MLYSSRKACRIRGPRVSEHPKTTLTQQNLKYISISISIDQNIISINSITIRILTSWTS